MIISHDHKLVFVKTIKTAGTSIEVFLSGRCGPGDVVTPVTPPEPGHEPRNHDGFRNHMPAYRIREVLGRKVWDRYTSVAVERNPWDKFLSFYHMLRRTLPDGASLSIDDYIVRGPHALNYRLYMDAGQTEVIVDHLVRYETLGTGLMQVFDQVGIRFDGDLGVRAKGEWRSDRRSYRDVLTPDQIKRVGEIYAREIELHGYTD